MAMVTNIHDIQNWQAVFYSLVLLLVTSNCTRGQCSVEVKERTDSTMYIESHAFEGVVFTKNRPLGVMTDINGNELNINILNFVEIPDTAQIWTPSLQQICTFEKRFESWWRSGNNSREKDQREIATKFEQIDQLLRQYIGYTINQKKKIRVAFFIPDVLKTIPRWKFSPVALDDGWPVYFAVRYDVDTGNINPEPLIGSE